MKENRVAQVCVHVQKSASRLERQKMYSMISRYVVQADIRAAIYVIQTTRLGLRDSHEDPASCDYASRSLAISHLHKANKQAHRCLSALLPFPISNYVCTPRLFSLTTTPHALCNSALASSQSTEQVDMYVIHRRMHFPPACSQTYTPPTHHGHPLSRPSSLS